MGDGSGSGANRRHRLPRGPLVAALLCLAVGLPALFLALPDAGPEPAGATAPGLRASALPEELQRAAPPIRLRDADGALVDTDTLAGTPYAVTFIFSECPDVCPLIAQELKLALEQIDAREGAEDVEVLMVSVDPRGDTPEAARRFLERNRLPANMRFLVGSQAELSPVWSDYFVGPQDPDRRAVSTHSAAIWLVDGTGAWRGRYSAGIPVAPEDLAHDLAALAAEAEEA